MLCLLATAGAAQARRSHKLGQQICVKMIYHEHYNIARWPSPPCVAPTSARQCPASGRRPWRRSQRRKQLTESTRPRRKAGHSSRPTSARQCPVTRRRSFSFALLCALYSLSAVFRTATSSFSLLPDVGHCRAEVNLKLCAALRLVRSDFLPSCGSAASSGCDSR